MVRTSITLEEGLFKELQHMAIDEDKTLKELMNAAIEEYVRRRKHLWTRTKTVKTRLEEGKL